MKVFTIYRPDGHFGHVTWTIFIYSLPSQGGSISNLALIDQAALEKKDLENGSHMHEYSPRAGADNPWGQFYINTFIQSFESFAASFPQ